MHVKNIHEKKKKNLVFYQLPSSMINVFTSTNRNGKEIDFFDFQFMNYADI